MDYMEAFVSRGYTESELSLYDTSESAMDKKIQSIVKEDYEYALIHDDQIRPKRMKAYQYYRGESLGNEREGRSKFVSKDIMTTIEWKMPSFMRYFCQNDVIASIKPIGSDDEERAETLEALINYDFFVGNKGFVFLYKWVKKSEMMGSAYVKSFWEEKFVEKPFTFDVLSEEKFNELAEDPDTEIISYTRKQVGITTEAPEEVYDKEDVVELEMSDLAPEKDTTKTYPIYEYYDVIHKKTIFTYRGPRAVLIPNENLLIDPDCTDIEDAKYVIEVYYSTIGELYAEQDSGKFKNVDLVVEGLLAKDDGNIASERGGRFTERGEGDPRNFNYESQQLARKSVMCKEYWGLVDFFDTGRPVWWLAVVANGVVLQSVPNPYNFDAHPYDDIRPNIDPDALEGIGCYDTIGPFQQAKTAMIRQMLDNMSFQNNQMWLVDRYANVDMSVLLRPRPGAIVRSDKVTNAVQALTPPALSGHVMQVFEFLQSILESLTGQTRYSQGTDASSLNQTATGISQIMQRSDQRNWLESKLMGETGIKSMLQKWISMNQQFLSEHFAYRVFDKVYEISVDDIEGVFDVTVSVGDSIAEVSRVVEQVLRLMQMAPQLMEAGAMNPDDFYQLYRTLLKKWGYKDFEKYSTDPEWMMKMKEQAEKLQLAIEALMSEGIITPEVLQKAVTAYQHRQGGQAVGGTGANSGRSNAGRGNAGGRETAQPVPGGTV